MTLTDFTLHISLTFTKFLYYKFIPLSYPENLKSCQTLVAVHSTLHEIVVTLDKNDYLRTANLLFLSFIAKSLAVFFLFARKFM